MLEQIELWKQTGKLVRLVANYGNNTVRPWIGLVRSYDQTGIVLEVAQSGKGAQREQRQLVCFPWYTATEISAED